MTSARVVTIALVAALTGCGDRAPPALWPEPPPPTLAEPIGAQKGAPETDPAPPGDRPAAAEGPGATEAGTEAMAGDSGDSDDSGDAAERARAADSDARATEASARGR